MKVKTNILPIAAVVLSLMIGGCGSQKKAATQQTNIEQERAALALERERLALEHEKATMQIEHEKAMKAAQQEGKVVIIPCENESYDGDGYMAGLGIVEGKADKGEGMRVALKAAKAEVMNKFIGAFKVGIEEYTNDMTVPSGDKRDMAKLEGGVKSAGGDAIDKYSQVVCRKILENDLGGFDTYLVIHVPTGDVKKAIASELEAMEVDYNASKFFDSLDKQMEQQKKYKDDELNNKRDYYKN